jgi:hypothetical protein
MKLLAVLFSLLVISSLMAYGQSNLVPLKIVINGKGSVTSLPPGLADCTSSCTVQVAVGTMLILHATPETGSNFGGWSGECLIASDCSLTMPSTARTVTASFDPPTAKVELSFLGLGNGKIVIAPPTAFDLACTRGSSNCVQTFPKGTVVTLKALADGDSVFAGWNSTGITACSSAAECSFTLEGALNLTAGFGFKVPLHDLQVTTSGTTGAVGGRVYSLTPEGAIDCGITCQAQVVPNAVKLVAVPNANSVLAGWSKEGNFISQFCFQDVICDLNLDTITSIKINAGFKANPLGVQPIGLTISTSPPNAGHFLINPQPNCSPTGCSNYTSTEAVQVQVFNDNGYEFVGWSGATGIPCAKTVSICNFFLKTNYDLTANFVPVSSISADLQMSLTAPATVGPLEELTVMATLHNAGPIEAKDISFRLSLPSGVNLISATSSAGFCRNGGVFCTITGLPNTSDATIVLKLRAPSNPGTLAWSAGAGSLTPDSSQGNRVANASTEVKGGTALALSVSKAANSPTDTTANKGASNVSMLEFKLSPNGAEAQALKGISLSANGTGNDTQDVLDVLLYRDVNQNAQVDSSDILLSSSGFETNDGNLNMNLNPANPIATAGSSYLIAVNFNSTLAMQHSRIGLGLAGLALFGLVRRRWRGTACGVLLSVSLVACPDPPKPNQDQRTYKLTLTDLNLEVVGQTVNVTGLPLVGATISVEK